MSVPQAQEATVTGSEKAADRQSDVQTQLEDQDTYLDRLAARIDLLASWRDVLRADQSASSWSKEWPPRQPSGWSAQVNGSRDWEQATRDLYVHSEDMEVDEFEALLWDVLHGRRRHHPGLVDAMDALKKWDVDRDVISTRAFVAAGCVQVAVSALVILYASGVIPSI